MKRTAPAVCENSRYSEALKQWTGGGNNRIDRSYHFGCEIAPLQDMAQKKKKTQYSP
jgi:hypothetical protein